ncbi:MAG: DNA-processing protein DprA, partial [Pseudomonadota bacterium]
ELRARLRANPDPVSVYRELLLPSAPSLSTSTKGARRTEQRMLAEQRQTLRSSGISLLAISTEPRVEKLAAIPDAPLLLYARGDLTALEGTAVAIVGARRASRSGLELAAGLAAELARAGVVIVSGLALGIDAAAHRGALEGGGKTIAVLGSGVDRCQPVSNAPLARAIVEAGGLLLSEYAPGTAARPHHFPERNRLISGLAGAVIVVEASKRSGSLITARLALEQGRDVLAVPGQAGLPNSAGTNALLKAGAGLVEHTTDVLEALGRDLPGFASTLADANAAPGDPIAQALLDSLDGVARSMDSLALALDLTPSDCAIHLTELELSGFVQRVAGGYIRRPAGF